jgi:O-antigen/teichoic acid export membrane protein
VRVSAPLVVAGWGVLNGALVAVLAGFGEQAAVLALYASAAALVEVIALVVWAGVRRRRRHRVWRRAPSGDSMLILAAGIAVAGLGWAFAWWFALASIPVFVLAISREISARQEPG